MDKVEIITTGSHCTIVIQEAHLSQNENIFQLVDTVISENTPHSIILDCRNIHKVNSSGIGKLIYLKKYIVEEKNIPFQLTNINPQILKTLRSVKVDDLLGLNWIQAVEFWATKTIACSSNLFFYAKSKIIPETGNSLDRGFWNFSRSFLYFIP